MATARDLNPMLLEMVEQKASGNQVFLSLDMLSRAGQVTLRQQGPGRYTVGLVSQPYPLERRR